MSLELIVLSSLLTKHQEMRTVAAALHEQNYNDARRLARTLNADYWPKPTRRDKSKVPEELVPLDAAVDPFVQEDEWGPAWGFCSELLHAPNPYARSPVADRERNGAKLRELAGKLVTLLNHHNIMLADGTLVAQMHAAPAKHRNSQTRRTTSKW